MTVRILYVDDEPDIREIAAMALELDPDFQVQTAQSGEAALEVLKNGAFVADVLLFDLMMPGIDGRNLLRAVRELPNYVATPVIFITARTQSSSIEQLIEQGAKAVITKPFDPMTLASEVRQAIGPMKA